MKSLHVVNTNRQYVFCNDWYMCVAIISFHVQHALIGHSSQETVWGLVNIHTSSYIFYFGEPTSLYTHTKRHAGIHTHTHALLLGCKTAV